MSNSTKSIIWFVLGPIGAGKTTYIKNVLLKQYKLDFLCTDDIIKEKGFKRYEDAVQYVRDLTQHKVDNNISFISEGTGQHEGLYEWFSVYDKDPTKEVRVTYIDTKLEDALKGNSGRTRVLNDETVKRVYYKSKMNKHMWVDFNCEYLFRDGDTVSKDMSVHSNQ